MADRRKGRRVTVNLAATYRSTNLTIDAQVHNLSKSGVGVRTDGPIQVGQTINIAIHQPALSLHGRGTVRHCSERNVGYLVGIAFEF